MASVRSRNTAPERSLLRAVRQLGFSPKAHVKTLPGCPDLSFPEEKTAVFLDGDFWHGRQWRNRGLTSLESQFMKTANRQYWITKIKRNVLRDQSVGRKLRRAGWKVVRIWESDWHRRPEVCIARLQRTLERKLST